MASINYDSPRHLIERRVVVLREEDVLQNKETNELLLLSLRKSQVIRRGPCLRKYISFTESMTSKDIEEVLKNAFPILADTKR